MARFFNDRNKAVKDQKKNGSQMSLPPGYLSGGYYEEEEQKKYMKKEYIVEYSKQIAVNLLSEGKNKKNKRSQIRKFYEYTLQVRELVRRKDNCFEMAEAELNRLIPFVRYAESRDRVSRLFAEFIEVKIGKSVV